MAIASAKVQVAKNIDLNVSHSEVVCEALRLFHLVGNNNKKVNKS